MAGDGGVGGIGLRRLKGCKNRPFGGLLFGRHVLWVGHVRGIKIVGVGSVHSANALIDPVI